MYNKQQRDQYNQMRARICEELGITENQYNKFRRIGQGLHSLYELSCNGEIEEADYETKTANYESMSDTLAKELGLNIFYQTDPRGATIYLSKGKIENNNYNRPGSECIY